MPNLKKVSFYLLIGIFAFMIASIVIAATSQAKIPSHEGFRVKNEIVYSYGEYIIPYENGPEKYIPYEFDWSKSVHGEDRPFFTEAGKLTTYSLILYTANSIDASWDATRLLRLVSIRESSMRGNVVPFDERGLLHRLKADQESSYDSWRKPRVQRIYKGNPYISNQKLWNTYGLTGQNSALFLYRWDKNGDPRMLGDSVINIFTYLRAARSNWHKMQGKIRCFKWDDHGSITERWSHNQKKAVKLRVGVYDRDENGDRIYEYVKVKPTWYTIHRATSGGKICPPWKKDDIARFYRTMFEKRARRVGLDPNAEVALSDLGKEPKDINQYSLWMKTWEGYLGRDIDWSQYEG